jgi:uncharacterized protein
MAETQLPQQINILRETDRGTDLNGALAIKGMTRLAPLLLNDDGEVIVNLQFGKDKEGWRFVKGKTDASVSMTCQRCLQPVSVELNGEFDLSPVLSDSQAKSLPSHYEPLLVERDGQSLLPIIEDELILQLPLVPMHDTEECHAKTAVVNEEQTVVDNPFVRELSKLKS